MDVMHRSSSNNKFIENEDDDHIKGKYDADDEHKSETSDKSQHVDESVIETTSPKTHSKRDVNIKLDNNDDNLKIERHRIQSEAVARNLDNPDDTKIDSKPLNEYLNEHERFLKFIDRTRQLSLYERKQLDRQREDLKKFQDKLVTQSEENDRKRLYQKKKEEDILNKKRAYLQRRHEEANLKEIRKPRILTTFRVSNKQNRSKSPTKSKSNRMESSVSSAMSQPKSIAHKFHTDSTARSQHHVRNHVESQTDTNSIHKLDTPRRIDLFDKHFKEHSDDTGQNLEELIVQFVEHSKRSWINQ